MTISTPRIKISSFARGSRSHWQLRGFTLTEVIVAAALSSLVLTGVMSSFLMIGRTSISSSSYSQNEAEIRRALDLFGQDARRASDIQWSSNRCITLTVAQPLDPAARVTYTYDDRSTGDTARCFYRTVESLGVISDKKILAREVSELSFQRFKLDRFNTGNEAVNDLETKQLQLTLRASRRGSTTTTASQTALSASYILRNKRVSN